MISGTSHDGVDAALVDFVDEGSGDLHGTVIRSGTEPYPPDLRERLVAAMPPAAVTLAEVCALDTLVGQHFAAVAAGMVAGAGGDLICSHGQTLFHWVAAGRVQGTLQVGQPAWIAEATGLPVLSDVRSADIAAGGQGAPLVAVLDVLLLAEEPGVRAALNLGGIANMTVLAPGRPVRAFDIGPANALIDAAVRRATGGRRGFDEGGRRAAAGVVDRRLLDTLLAEPYYARDAPKSTGKELFHGDYLEAHMQGPPLTPDDDVIATVTALTARVVADAVEHEGVSAVFASGGGVANPTLMRMLSEALPGVRLRTSDELGASSDAKEAIAFALIGYLSAHGLPGNVPVCTGASGPRVLGSLTPATPGPSRRAGDTGAVSAVMPAPVKPIAVMPTRLRLATPLTRCGPASTA